MDYMTTEKKQFYITTPLYYVNAKPHVGTLYSTLLADVIARWQRLKGKEVYFLTGTDEHGQKIAQQAAHKEMAPQQFVDSMIPAFQAVWERYGISYDRFMRTTELGHKQTVTRWIEALLAKGDIYKARYEGWYCLPDETFVTAEQAVECEGQLMCPGCNRLLQRISEENYFFKLSAYQEKLLAFYAENPDFIYPKERANEVIAFVRSGLKDLSISRMSVEWGIPFPGDPEHTVYVWGDALMNYVSALGFMQPGSRADEKFKRFWPADVQVMGKDIIKFHAVYFPAFLMAVDVVPALRLMVHGYLLVDNDKMSKSKGNALDPLLLADQFGVDQVRFYLTRHTTMNHDSSMSIPDIAARIESDLANNLGNLLQRAASLALRWSATEVVPPATWSVRSQALRESCVRMMVQHAASMDALHLTAAYAEVWHFLSEVNSYFHEMEPWKLAKDSGALFKEVLAATAQSLYLVAHLITPVMPFKAKQLLASLGHTMIAPYSTIAAALWNVPCTYFVPREPLFVRPELPLAPEQEKPVETPAVSPAPVISAPAPSESAEQAPTYITIEDLARVELIVGRIRQCERMAKSEKMLSMQVDLGTYGTRHILAGVGDRLKPEELQGKCGLFVTNLAPRKMLGVVSQGMMLVAKDGEALSLVSVSDAIAPGTRLG